MELQAPAPPAPRVPKHPIADYRRFLKDLRRFKGLPSAVAIESIRKDGYFRTLKAEFPDMLPLEAAPDEQIDNEPAGPCFAVVNEDGSGPAFGIGLSRGKARCDAADRGFPAVQGTKIVKITPASFAEVKAGNPDAWVEA